MPAPETAVTRHHRSPTLNAVLMELAVAVVAGGVALWVTFTVADTERLAVGVACVAMALLASVLTAVATYQAGQAGRARARLAALDADVARMTDEVLPTAAERLRGGATASTILAETNRPANGSLNRILWVLMQEVGATERRRAAAMAACANAAGRVQALTTSTLADLREMENRHSDPAVLGDLLKLDHSTSRTGRLADGIAVLTGARSGRRWTRPIVMESILRGAMARIQAYQRVRVHSASTAAIAGYAAEGVMNALAELMDNAASFSPPLEEVHVYVEELRTGIAVTIEDGGLGMKPQALARAEAAVSATEPADLAGLSGTRLGLAVVGRLARKHGLQVFFRPSSRGGTGVVVRIPNQLITRPRERPEPASVPVGAAAATGAPDAATAPAAMAALDPLPEPTPAEPREPAPEPAPEPEPVTATGGLPPLPRRFPGGTLASRPAPAARTPPPARPRTDAGQRFGAYWRRPSRPDGTAPDPENEAP